MQKIYYTVLFIFLSCSSHAVEGPYVVYEEFESTIRYLVSNNIAEELSGKKRDQIQHFAEQINDYIISEDIKSLVNIIFKDDFRFYAPKGKSSNNIASKIIKEFSSKNGFYYFFIFNKEGLTRNEKTWAYPAAKDVDIRKYLIKYKNRLKWRILYLPKEKVYEAWFSIPDHFILDFGHFHYRIKEVNNKYILIGF